MLSGQPLTQRGSMWLAATSPSMRWGYQPQALPLATLRRIWGRRVREWRRSSLESVEQRYMKRKQRVPPRQNLRQNFMSSWRSTSSGACPMRSRQTRASSRMFIPTPRVNQAMPLSMARKPATESARMLMLMQMSVRESQTCRQTTSSSRVTETLSHSRQLSPKYLMVSFELWVVTRIITRTYRQKFISLCFGRLCLLPSVNCRSSLQSDAFSRPESSLLYSLSPSYIVSSHSFTLSTWPHSVSQALALIFQGSSTRTLEPLKRGSRMQIWRLRQSTYRSSWMFRRRPMLPALILWQNLAVATPFVAFQPRLPAHVPLKWVCNMLSPSALPGSSGAEAQ